MPATWGEAFAQVEAASQPVTDRAATAAAHFADFREFIEARNARQSTEEPA